MFDNDHTDAEDARRAHAYEMGEDDVSDERWNTYAARAKRMLLVVEATTEKQGLDGDEETDGFSYDGAFDAFQSGVEVTGYFALVMDKRKDLALKGNGDKAFGEAEVYIDQALSILLNLHRTTHNDDTFKLAAGVIHQLSAAKAKMGSR